MREQIIADLLPFFYPCAVNSARLNPFRAIAHAPRFLRVFLGLQCTFCVLIGYLHTRTAAATIMTNASLVETRETLYVPDTRTTRLIFLGYDQAAADIMWLRCVEYFARHFTSDRRYQWLTHFVDQVIALDPRFRRVYHWAGASVLYGQTFTDNNVRLSNRFYEAAVKQFPEDSEAALRLGLNYYVEMKGNNEEERRKFQERGADYLEMAANMPGASPMILRLVASIRTKLGATDLALQSLLQLLEATEEPQQRAAIKARIEELGGGEAASALAEQMESFEKRRKASFEYLSPAFFLLLDANVHPESAQADRGWRELLPDVTVGEAPLPVETP